MKFCDVTDFKKGKYTLLSGCLIFFFSNTCKKTPKPNQTQNKQPDSPQKLSEPAYLGKAYAEFVALLYQYHA